jgi:hypothetical protein
MMFEVPRYLDFPVFSPALGVSLSAMLCIPRTGPPDESVPPPKNKEICNLCQIRKWKKYEDRTGEESLNLQ